MAHINGEPIRPALHGEQWDDDDRHVEKLILLTGDYRVARAYEEAVRRRPVGSCHVAAEDTIAGR
jgi:hypothetical protein